MPDKKTDDKTDNKKTSYSRRQILRAGLLSTAAAATTSMWLGRTSRSHAQSSGARSGGQEMGPNANSTFLIVLTASGGASLIDSVLAIRASESANASTLNTFPDALVQNIADSPFRAVDLDRASLGPIPVPVNTRQSDFVRRHHRDMMVTTWTRTSVNHTVAQRRSVTGNEAWSGRTLQEIAAWTHGRGYPLPNVHLSSGSGFTARGSDSGLPEWAFGETVADPALWPLALDGGRGLARAVKPTLLARARRLRDERLDPASTFAKVFGQSPRLKHWQRLRSLSQPDIEERRLIDKLLFLPESAEYPLSAYGFQPSPAAAAVREAFPNLQRDPLHAQAALAFLLLKFQVSTALTLGPNFNFVARDGVDVDFYDEEAAQEFQRDDIINPPLGFDFSHQAHRSTQAFMWDRIFAVADGLIGLLKAEEWLDGQSLWDRTMMVIATDFGRDKRRPANAPEFGTAHHLNNGLLVLSPLVNGNRLLGGVDPDTGLTYGFDPLTGAPDRGRHMSEKEIFSGLVQVLGAQTDGAGLPPMPIMARP